MLTLAIIFAIAAVAGWYFYFQSRKSAVIYFRSYKSLSVEIPALRLKSNDLIRSLARAEFLFYAACAVAAVLWVIGYWLACKLDKLEKS